MIENVVLAPSRLLSLIEQSSPEPDTQKTEQATQGFQSDQWLPALIIFGASIAIGLMVRFLVERVLRGRNEIIARLVARTLLCIVVAIGVFYAMSQMGIRVGLLLGGLGIGGFALAFALRDTLENLISGVFLQVRQPFNYDDLVTLGEYSGSVDDINLRSVEMTRFSGEKVIIPSSHVLQNPIENLTVNATRRLSIGIGIDYQVDVEVACASIARAVSEVDGVLDDPAPVTIFKDFGASSVNVSARFWINSDGDYFGIERACAAAIKRQLEADDVDIPFPQTEVRMLGPSNGDDVSEAGDEVGDEESGRAGDHTDSPSREEGSETEPGDVEDGAQEAAVAE